ncbi:MAG: hypothetical protein HY744_12130 [Deltaproteobacteria bacterium]|nr:hypothetical protein [Deltaproteobacteria bacterium]
MMKMPDPGLYRTTRPYPGREPEIPAGALVYVGTASNGGLPFVVRPSQNRHNRWHWAEPTIPMRAVNWAETLMRLPAEGFYTLPEDLQFEAGGRWLRNALVQLGYNSEGRGIIFVAEQHEDEERNVLVFGERGRMIDDGLLHRLVWAPILPVGSRKQEGAVEA